MATKVQAKAAIDAAVVLAKNDIDNIHPVGVNITGGRITFNPTKFVFQWDAGGVLATATSWLATLTSNLAAASRTYTINGSRGRRLGDLAGQNNIIVATDLANYIIVNF